MGGSSSRDKGQEKQQAPPPVVDPLARFLCLGYPDNGVKFEENQWTVSNSGVDGKSCLIYCSEPLAIGSRYHFKVLATEAGLSLKCEFGVSTCDPDGIRTFKEHLLVTCGEGTPCAGRSVSFKVTSDVKAGDMIVLKRKQDGHIVVSLNEDSSLLELDNFEWMPEVTPFVVLNGSVTKLGIREFVKAADQPTPRPQMKRHSSETLCGVCLDREINCVLLNCGHVRMCFACAEQVRQTDGYCPFCRAEITEVKQVFL